MSTTPYNIQGQPIQNWNPATPHTGGGEVVLPRGTRGRWRSVVLVVVVVVVSVCVWGVWGVWGVCGGGVDRKSTRLNSSHVD